MNTTPGPRTLRFLGLVLTAAGFVLARQAWVADPRLRFPPFFTYVIVAIAIIAGVMLALQSFGIRGWNDLLAGMLLLAASLEFFWLAFGPGHRPCRIGWWQPPEPVCRAGLTLAAVFLVATAVWALRRRLRRRRAE